MIPTPAISLSQWQRFAMCLDELLVIRLDGRSSWLASLAVRYSWLVSRHHNSLAKSWLSTELLFSVGH